MRWITIISVSGIMALTPLPALSQSVDRCSADAVPEAERRAMQNRFRQIAERQGRAAAETYAREQGQAFRQRMIEQGLCSENGSPPPPRTQTPRTQTPRAQTPRPAPGSRDDQPRCRVENRAVPDLNGGMNLALVTVCD